jgi:hypothetical protein
MFAIADTDAGLADRILLPLAFVSETTEPPVAAGSATAVSLAALSCEFVLTWLTTYGKELADTEWLIPPEPPSDAAQLTEVHDFGGIMIRSGGTLGPVDVDRDADTSVVSDPGEPAQCSSEPLGDRTGLGVDTAVWSTGHGGTQLSLPMLGCVDLSSVVDDISDSRFDDNSIDSLFLSLKSSCLTALLSKLSTVRKLVEQLDNDSVSDVDSRLTVTPPTFEGGNDDVVLTKSQLPLVTAACSIVFSGISNTTDCDDTVPPLQTTPPSVLFHESVREGECSCLIAKQCGERLAAGVEFRGIR